MCRVSVCIPSYNATPYIGSTIQSILDSTCTDFEIVVSDDASTDGTRQVVEAIADERVRFFPHRDNVGAPANWNRALERASGEFVGLLNHDDLVGPFWLAFAVRVLETNPQIGWVSTAFRIVDEQGQALGAVCRFDETGQVDRGQAFARLAQLNGLGPVYLARRNVLAEIGGYDESVGPGADNDLFLRLAARYPLYYSRNPHHAAWRLHASNLTHRWGIVAQTSEGLRILDKTFDDAALPQELRAHERTSYRYFYRKILARAREREERGKTEVARQLVRLLDDHQRQRFPSSPLISLSAHRP